MSRFCAIALLLTAAVGASAQVQTKEQQACTLVMNKALAAVSGAASKGSTACLRDASKGKLAPGTTLDACVAADASGKLARATARTAAGFAAKCAAPGAAPPYGVTDADTVNTAAIEGRRELLHDVLGEDLDLAVLLEAAGKDAARCQQLAAREAGACHAARVSEFNRCKKAGLKRENTPFDDAADLAACFGADPKLRIAKRCDTAMERQLVRSCQAKGVDLALALPGCGSGDVAATRACLDRAAACRTCLAIDDADGLGLDCDLADDGAANASCGAVPLGDFVCPIDPESGFLLESATIFQTGVLGGSVSMHCGTVDPTTGTAPCECEIDAFEPIEVPAGWVCIAPVDGCVPGEIACNGGPSQDVTIAADHDIGVCTGNPDCAAQCGSLCGSSGASVWDSGCEGFCEGGGSDGGACTSDAQCPAGSCNGVPGATHGNVCQCQCADLAGAPSTPGGLRCNLGARIRVEAALPCDGTDVIVDTGDRCLPLTTETAQATLTDRDHVAGANLPSGSDVLAGQPVTCDALRASGPAGMLLVAAANAFDLLIAGDVYLLFTFECQ